MELRKLMGVSILFWGLAAFGQSNAVDLPPSAIEAWRKNNYAEAERVIRAQIDSTSPNTVNLGFLAAILDREGRFNEADPYYRKAMALVASSGSGSVPLLNNYGNHCAQMGDESCATKAFRRLLEIVPEHRNANLQLARIALSHNNGEEALKLLAHVGDQDPAVSLLRAEALYDSGENEQAATLLQGIENSNQSDPGVVRATGMLLARMGRFEQAEQALTLALSTNHDDVDLLREAGITATRAGHISRGIQMLEEAKRLRPVDAAVLSALGRAYATQGQFPNAIDALGEARKLDPHNKANLLALAHTLDAAGDLLYAALVYDDLAALDPEDESIRFDRALDYASTGRHDQAVEEFKHHIASFPNDPQGYFRLALATEQRDPEEAVRLLGKAIDLDGGFTAARFERGMWLRQIGRLTEALPDLKASVEADPENVEAASQLGGALLSLGRPQEAESVLRNGLMSDPANRAMLMHLGRALAMNGKDTESRQVLAKLDALGPAPMRGDQSSTVLEFINLPPAERLSAVIERLRKASQRKPDDLLIKLKLGDALLEAGRKEEATIVFQSIHSEDASVQLNRLQGIERSAGPTQALHEMEQIPTAPRTGALALYRTVLLKQAAREKDGAQCAELTRLAIPGQLTGSDTHTSPCAKPTSP